MLNVAVRPGTAAADERTIGYAPREVLVRHGENGCLVLECCQPLTGVETHIVNYLERWAAAAPDRVFLAQRAADRSWETITYAAAWRRVQGIAQGLIDAGHCGDNRAVMILSPASIEHGLLMLAAMLIGAPVVPVSPAYSLLPEARPRLHEIAELIRPAFVFGQTASPYAAVRDTPGLADAAWLNPAALAEWYGLNATAAVAARRAAVGGDTVAKILFTSGSTGSPKGVINTQSMLCHAIASTSVLIPDPVVGTVFVDWMPWHHTMGGNSVVHGTLRSGGTLYIDDGKPLPGQFERTIENLRDGRPTVMQSIPAAYALLVAALERDDDFRIAFFSRLERLIYAGASLPSDIWDRMQALAVRTRGRQIDFGSALGTTETGPGITVTHWASEGDGEVGLPVAGVEIKLLPVEDRYEIRVRGPNVTPGYFGRPDLTAAAFDQEGFYRTGDLVQLVDPARPELGLKFAGRLSENFKLANGSWVATGELRFAVLEACRPLVGDVVLAGVDRDDVRAMLWPAPGSDLSAPRALHFLTADIAACLADFNAWRHGATQRIAAFRILMDPPSIGAGEMTDKGYVNQRGVLARRSPLVDDLYAAEPSRDVIPVPPCGAT
ncbi:AMP-binding protein (plasmid) [Polymorphobacter sp. PAMC 29334]|uniref:AMP-binding protein n=1 Tax=Polymorphobacter sp. PAMC 29334 TaxID=2862331 RepID=UPI001C76D97E|nr:AMP-binding protein [Polymorphobacter sp. PAMC 29334]QYE32968.1 AMP-binding protein [Polymorphobacter sp. PAMC 29334]